MAVKLAWVKICYTDTVNVQSVDEKKSLNILASNGRITVPLIVVLKGGWH